jgi:A/G-specific adenine glycosylase
VDVRTAERLHRSVLDWYDAHGRALYLRTLADPYAIWVAEIMSQQTQVSRIEAAHRRFIARFPSVRSLAESSIAEVLRVWAGLGYNRRAVNLHRAARVIVCDHGGRLPAGVAELSRLPGVGPYTARAIAATAFGTAVTALDTNAARVVTRCLHAVRGDAARADRSKLPTGNALQKIADALAPASRAADWNHALMDIGATICCPRPRCDACPLRRLCTFGRQPRERAGTTEQKPFPGTRRWLRGRIVDDLRRTRPGEWTVIRAPIGVHDSAAVESALAGLERDGIIERGIGGVARLPGDTPG